MQMHGALQDVLKRLSMPPLPRLETTSTATEVPSAEEFADPLEDVGPSTDNSPKLSPKDDSMPHVPIQSLYEITKLRALRADDAVQESPTSHPNGRASRTINDFITTGSVSLEDAERLFDLYLNWLDHFMYRVGGRYSDLTTVRRASPILTACICTVAALHDANSNHLYGICKREFQRLMAASMFDRRIDRDHLRAMCIGSYWLSDISWTLSGYAIRRATEVNLNANYRRAIAESNEDAADCMRLWYTLYICDQHLSILYGRPSIIREDFSIQGWETLLRALWVTDSDRRLISQAALLIIMRNVQELFGPDTGSPVPSAYAAQIVNFSRQLDQWVGHWSTNIPSMSASHLMKCLYSLKQEFILAWEGSPSRASYYTIILQDCIYTPTFSVACPTLQSLTTSKREHLQLCQPQLPSSTYSLRTKISATAWSACRATSTP